MSTAIAPVHARVVALQLRDIQLEEEYKAARLTAAIQEESNARESYIQEATLVRERTGVEVLKIENDAKTVEVAASSRAHLIVASAEYEARRLVEDARALGLKALYDAVGLSSEAHKASLDYLVTLGEAHNRKQYVNFDAVPTLAA